MTAAGTDQRLDELLAEGVTGAKERERSEFDRIAGPHASSIVLFGAGKMGQVALAGLRQAGVEPLAFSDNNAALWGKPISGVTVLSPAEAARRFGDGAVFVLTIWGYGSADPMSGRVEKLRQLGCRRVTTAGPLFWKYPEIFLPRIPAMDLPHKVHEQAELVRRAFDLLADERSRREFIAQLRWRLHFDFDGLPDPVPDAIYFPADIVRLREDEMYVDCGAYDGDTIRAFLDRCAGCFRGVIAFEPDPISVARLRRMVDALPAEVRARVRVIEAAAGQESGCVRISANGELGSAVGAGGAEVRCVTLDEALADERPSYIKLDIEAFEPHALGGAAGIIQRDAPVLAACAYHVQDHLWTLPRLMHSLNPDYRIFLRRHIQLVEDLVCYAVPAGRSLA